MSSGVELLIQVDEHVGGGAIHIGDWLCGNEYPSRSRSGQRHLFSNHLAEDVGVGEKEGGVPTQHEQARDLFAIRMAFQIVIAGQLLCFAQDGVMRLPGSFEELKDGEKNGDNDALQDPNQRHAQDADQRQYKLASLLRRQAAQCGYIEEAERSGDDNGG